MTDYTINALTLLHTLLKYVCEKLTTLTDSVFNIEGAVTFVWLEWIWMKATQYIYKLSADEKRKLEYSRTIKETEKIGYYP